MIAASHRQRGRAKPADCSGMSPRHFHDGSRCEDAHDDSLSGVGRRARSVVRASSPRTGRRRQARQHLTREHEHASQQQRAWTVRPKPRLRAPTPRATSTPKPPSAPEKDWLEATTDSIALLAPSLRHARPSPWECARCISTISLQLPKTSVPHRDFDDRDPYLRSNHELGGILGLMAHISTATRAP